MALMPPQNDILPNKIQPIIIPDSTKPFICTWCLERCIRRIADFIPSLVAILFAQEHSVLNASTKPNSICTVGPQAGGVCRVGGDAPPKVGKII